MRAMVLESLAPLSERPEPLQLLDWPDPVPGETEVLLQVSVCGVCHTELDEIEGRTAPALPCIPGHQVVGTVVERGRQAQKHTLGQRVGVAWIYSSCGQCRFCLEGLENLCPQFRATGRDAPGGYAQLMSVPESSAHPIPDEFSDREAAPLLCAGAIGYRSMCLAQIRDGQPVGLTGFGASGHLMLQMIRHRYPRSPVHVFARNPNQRKLALELGAASAGESPEAPPQPLTAIIDTTPVWQPVLDALGWLAPGGRLVINAIRKENDDRNALLQLDYGRHLWMEKEIKSVANVTAADVSQCLELAARISIRPTVESLPLAEANVALGALRSGRHRGAIVLSIA